MIWVGLLEELMGKCVDVEVDLGRRVIEAILHVAEAE